MARTAIPLTKQLRDSSVVTTPSGGTAADAVNGMVVSVPGSDRLPEPLIEEITLRVTQGTGARVVTIVAATDPGNLEKGLGNLVVTVAADTTRDIGPFSSARFRQKGTATDPGGLWVNFDAATNTTVRAIHTPRTK